MRTAALLLAGTLSVHEVRFLAGYGRHADAAQAAQGHAYLSWVVPLSIVALLAAGAELGLRVAASGSVARPSTSVRMRVLWPVASASLLAAYVAQEMFEGWLAVGHPGGLAGVLGHGGWIAIPVAVAVGGLIALALRGSEAALAATRPGWLLPRVSTTPAPLVPLVACWLAPTDAVARFLAGRGPPVSSV
jgi:hypothetical protein